MAITILLFMLALALLYKGGDLFVDAAIDLARRFRISEVLIGATIVSIGTTIPETTVSALAAAHGLSGVAYGNALGSVICNTSLIAGVLLLFAPGAIRREDLSTGTVFFFGAEVLFIALSMLFNSIVRIEGAILLLFFGCYIWVNLVKARRAQLQSAPTGEPRREAPLYHTLMLLCAGGVMVFVGSNLLINNGTVIALALGVPDQIIALTFIALGTSLPELVTAITAISKGHAAMSLGNIIGANILNLTSVIGLSALIQPLTVSTMSIRTDCIIAAAVMGILTLPALRRAKTSRVQGAILVAVYAWYCISQMNGLLSADSANTFAPYFIMR